MFLPNIFTKKQLENKKLYERHIFKTNITVDTNRQNAICLHQQERVFKKILRLKFFIHSVTLKLQVIFFRFWIYLFNLPLFVEKYIYLSKRKYILNEKNILNKMNSMI